MADDPIHEEIHDLANAVRRLYNRMRSVTDQLHAGDGLSAQRRTLMMDLHRRGPQTVPALAAARFISRQIIQTQVNDLQKIGYVEARTNPEHKRSSLIALTETGERRVAEMVERESAWIEALGWKPDPDELATCLRVLRTIDQKLEER